MTGRIITMIKIKNLCKDYGTVRAVDDLNLTIDSGEFFGFLGPNGAGKTTTIKIITGILKPTKGDVSVCGHDVISDPLNAKRRIGYIPDRPYLYEKLTGREFLEFVGKLYDLEEGYVEETSKEYLEAFKLYDWVDELIDSYSHGMRQKLIITSALLHNPEVIVVDEPMVGLDPMGVKIVKELFKKLCAKGVTIFMSTHTLEVAEEMCDRIGIIQNGKLIAAGTTTELKEKAALKSAEPGLNLEEIFLGLTGGAYLLPISGFSITA
jgi:ABC-2 type transport system ATP-binding protein